ncbi:MAG: citrate lyase beta subunit, partial [Saprospiraceae bacterium]
MSFTQYPPKRTRLQRSELAVPASEPHLFQKAADSNADYIFLDCEDAVIPADKEKGRENVI